MDRLEEIRKRDAKVTLEEPIGARLLACSDRRWLLSEVDRWRFGYTEASNDRDRERDKWIAAEREIERLREALMYYSNPNNPIDPEQKFDGQWMHGDANDILQVVVGQLDEARREIERLRAALQSIENFTISPYHPAILARRALAGEEE